MPTVGVKGLTLKDVYYEHKRCRLTYLGDVADKRFQRLRSMLPFRGLSVCLCVTFVHCAQTAEDIEMISYAYNSPVSLPESVKIWLTSVNPFLSNFFPNWPTPCWLECRRHSMVDPGTAVRGR